MLIYREGLKLHILLNKMRIAAGSYLHSERLSERSSTCKQGLPFTMYFYGQTYKTRWRFVYIESPNTQHVGQAHTLLPDHIRTACAVLYRC